jgi:hypothetical protein
VRGGDFNAVRGICVVGRGYWSKVTSRGDKIQKRVGGVDLGRIEHEPDKWQEIPSTYEFEEVLRVVTRISVSYEKIAASRPKVHLGGYLGTVEPSPSRFIR